MTSATLRERLTRLRELEPEITQAAAARKLNATPQRVSALAHEMGMTFARKPARRGSCSRCGRVRQLRRDRFCGECAA